MICYLERGRDHLGEPRGADFLHLSVAGTGLVDFQASITSRFRRPLIVLFAAAFLGLYLALSGSEIRLDFGGVLFALLASCGAAFTFIRGARVWRPRCRRW